MIFCKSFVVISIFALALQSIASVEDFYQELITAARERTSQSVQYNGAYKQISYPMGDVPKRIGVCTDLIIRAYRAVNVDLQELLHIDIRSNFNVYPKLWGLSQPDTNIDHRRVPNLQKYFERNGQTLSISQSSEDYKYGNLVTWMLPGNRPHIGIVSNEFVAGTSRPKIIHNIGSGPVEDDILFQYKITGHYRFKP